MSKDMEEAFQILMNIDVDTQYLGVLGASSTMREALERIATMIHKLSVDNMRTSRELAAARERIEELENRFKVVDVVHSFKTVGMNDLKQPEMQVTTKVYWFDEDMPTCVTNAVDELYDPEKGLAMCFLKRAAGFRGSRRLLNRYCGASYEL